MEKIILIGGGGHCKSIIDAIDNRFEVVGIIDKDICIRTVLGISIIGNEEKLQDIYDSGVRNAFIAIGGINNSTKRKVIYNKLKKIGYSFPNIIDKTAIIAKNVVLKEGIFIGKQVVINSGSIIGGFSIINTSAVIEHDCIVGQFVHVAPAAVLCGNVKVKSNSHIGANATIIQGISIGRNVLIGAGTVVIEDLQSNLKVCGNPARRILSE